MRAESNCHCLLLYLCKKVVAGGAYMLNTPAAVTAKTTLARMRKIITDRA
jgi:ribosomal protein L37AE/L43A